MPDEAVNICELEGLVVVFPAEEIYLKENDTLMIEDEVKDIIEMCIIEAVQISNGNENIIENNEDNNSDRNDRDIMSKGLRNDGKNKGLSNSALALGLAALSLDGDVNTDIEDMGEDAGHNI